MSTTDSYKLLILGGGTAGTTMASKFASKLGTGQVAVIEPSKVRTHFLFKNKHSRVSAYVFTPSMK